MAHTYIGIEKLPARSEESLRARCGQGMRPRFAQRIALVVALIAYSAGVRASDAVDCAGADTLRAAKLLGTAEQEYLRLLKIRPDLQCANDGARRASTDAIRALAKAREAERYRNIGVDSAALAAFIEALSIDASCSEAIRGLTAMGKANGTPSGDEFAQAEALAAMGFEAEAAEKVKESLKRNPNRPVPSTLQYLSGGKIPVWRDLSRNFVSWGRPLAQILAALFAVAILATFITRRWILNPILQISEFSAEDDLKALGKSVALMIQDALSRVSASQGTPTIGLVRGEIEAINVPAQLNTVFPLGGAWISAALAMLSFTQPRRLVQVTGHLLGGGSRGPAINIALCERQRVVASATIWYDEVYPSPLANAKPDPSQFHYLAEPAAIWLLFELSERYS